MELENLLKTINKQFNDQIVRLGVDRSKKEKFSLGSPGLDFITYNSIPEGIFIELSGTENSGKSLLSFLMAADYIKKQKLKQEENRKHILFVDAEGTLDPEWCMTSAGYDVNSQEVKTIYLTPMGQSAEQIFDMVKQFVLSGQIGLVIFDSITAIAPQLTNDESFEKKDMGGLSKPLADFVKRCTGIFNKYNTTFIGINGTIMNISGYGSIDTTQGGTYWKRACSLRLKVKKGTPFDDDGNDLKSSAENPSGNVIEVALLKSKFCRSDRKLGRCHLNYRNGIDIVWDTIETAITLGLIDDSIQGSFRFLDLTTGEILLDSDGKEIKIRGRKNIKPYLIEHPNIFKQLYNKVYEKISDKEDKNIKSFEQLFNINVEESFKIVEDE